MTPRLYSGPMARNRLLRMPNYVPSADFLQGVGWKREGGGNVLTESHTKAGKPAEDAVCIIVGEVSEHKLDASSIGNYRPQYNALLTGAKIQFTLERPNDIDFGPDYDIAIANLKQCQNGVAIPGLECLYMLLPPPPVASGSDAASINAKTTIRFSSLLTELRSVPIPITDPIDDEDTATWPIPLDHQQAFDNIKRTHKMVPLNLFDEDGEFVKPEEVASRLKGALVEVYFRIKHFYIGTKEPKINAFTPHVEQVVILRRPLAKTASPYKSRKGPYRPRPRSSSPTAPSHDTLAFAAKTFLPPPYQQSIDNPSSESASSGVSDTSTLSESTLEPSSFQSALSTASIPVLPTVASSTSQAAVAAVVIPTTSPLGITTVAVPTTSPPTVAVPNPAIPSLTVGAPSTAIPNLSPGISAMVTPGQSAHIAAGPIQLPRQLRSAEALPVSKKQKMY